MGSKYKEIPHLAWLDLRGYGHFWFGALVLWTVISVLLAWESFNLGLIGMTGLILPIWIVPIFVSYYVTIKCCFGLIKMILSWIYIAYVAGCTLSLWVLLEWEMDPGGSLLTMGSINEYLIIWAQYVVPATAIYLLIMLTPSGKRPARIEKR